LDEHDLINIDVTVFLDGYHGDTSRTFVLPAAVSLACCHAFQRVRSLLTHTASPTG
jgi:methionine aminopeptidase